MEADKGEGSEDEQRSSELVAVPYLATEFYAHLEDSGGNFRISA